MCVLRPHKIVYYVFVLSSWMMSHYTDAFFVDNDELVSPACFMLLFLRFCVFHSGKYMHDMILIYNDPKEVFNITPSEKYEGGATSSNDHYKHPDIESRIIYHL